MGTRTDRSLVANQILNAVGNMLECFADNPDCGYYDDIKHLSVEAVGEIAADLLKRLPGNGWDSRIPNPK